MLHDLCVTLCVCSEGSDLFHINSTQNDKYKSNMFVQILPTFRRSDAQRLPKIYIPVPLTKIVTKSTFVQCSRSNHTFESIGSVSIISQSSISPISSFTCRSFNRLNHSYCFIDPFIPQKYEIEKTDEIHKSAQSV